MSGSGMKQGRQALGGAKRQEAEKAWRRMQSGLGSPPIKPLSGAGKRCRGRNLKGGAARAFRFGDVRGGGSVPEVISEGERKPKRGFPATVIDSTRGLEPRRP
jgi:hypothetical protein